MIENLFITYPKEIELIFNLLLAFACGLAIGIEREFKSKPAGISTHITVITASMIFSFMSALLSQEDPTRIASQIVSGVGFLGAGIILKSEVTHTISNLTTAASVWYSAGIGMALGFNMYFIAIAATVYILLINRIPNIAEVEDSPLKRIVKTVFLGKSS